ncbi:FixH family protein [Echinicola jeungdonensis]|uniref:FixH family protein n=1 Tax=Echinicola jeungdonensis TaxID=709343 RepID=A0ABV5J2A7_9BACT|nr:FixH family protein [Echinicola jeungdonensis]MDN3667785.1 FixH family protein [Echinicola jeungdonensis]
MNWGKGLILVFIAFGAMMATMVTICVKQDDIHLVTQQYYEEEIKYQEHIQKVANAAELGQEVIWFDANTKKLGLELENGAEGTLWLFRPSDARMDHKIPVKFSEKSPLELDLKDLKSGYWRVKLTWKNDGKEYFQEKKINL